MIEDGRLPDGSRLIGSQQGCELVSSESAKRNAQKTKNARDLSGKLHKRAMIAARKGIFNSWRVPQPGTLRGGRAVSCARRLRGGVHSGRLAAMDSRVPVTVLTGFLGGG